MLSKILSSAVMGIDAYQENDNVYIRIKDDGRGLQTERIRSRAIERGLISEELGRAMREEEVWQLIFAPGFSTAEKVTDISGRGIGMSAVKEAVSAIGGEVVVGSVAGAGSNITLSMPLPKSVLITRCLFIMISGMQLGVPNENVYRIVHFDGENDTAQLSKMEDSYVLSLEEELIPVIQLDQLLGVPKIEIDESKVKTIAVLRTSKGASLGVVVSDVLEFEDTVVKPFTDHLKAFDVFYGTTFLGDGSIGLIFNVDGLVEACKAKAFYRFNVNVKSRDIFFQEIAG
jgi:two-component system chemotaxis sensor kinase CheA